MAGTAQNQGKKKRRPRRNNLFDEAAPGGLGRLCSLLYLYIVKKESIYTLKDKLDSHPGTLKLVLKKYGVKVRDADAAGEVRRKEKRFSFPERFSSVKDSDLAIEMYRSGHIMREIAERFACSIATVSELIYKNNVVRRPKTTFFNREIEAGRSQVLEAVRMYVKENESCESIASHFGCTSHTVRRCLKDAGVEITSFSPTKTLSEQILQDRRAGATESELAEYFDTDRGTIRKILHTNGMRGQAKGLGITKLAKNLGIGISCLYRLIALERLGGRCACGESRYVVLQINHKFGKNLPIDKRTGKRDQAAIFAQHREIALGTIALDDFGVLCAICNLLHEVERGNKPSFPENIREEVLAILAKIDSDPVIKKRLSERVVSESSPLARCTRSLAEDT